MLIVYRTKTFRKSLKRIARRDKTILGELEQVVECLANGKLLDAQYLDHALKGQFVGHRECHLSCGLLLIYSVHDGLNILSLTDIGTHSDLFGR